MAHSRRRIEGQGREGTHDLSPLAGKPAPQEMLVEPARLAHLLVLVIAAVYDITYEKPMFHSAP